MVVLGLHVLCPWVYLGVVAAVRVRAQDAALVGREALHLLRRLMQPWQVIEARPKCLAPVQRIKRLELPVRRLEPHGRNSSVVRFPITKLVSDNRQLAPGYDRFFPDQGGSDLGVVRRLRRWLQQPRDVVRIEGPRRPVFVHIFIYF